MAPVPWQGERRRSLRSSKGRRRRLARPRASMHISRIVDRSGRRARRKIAAKETWRITSHIPRYPSPSSKSENAGSAIIPRLFFACFVGIRRLIETSSPLSLPPRCGRSSAIAVIEGSSAFSREPRARGRYAEGGSPRIDSSFDSSFDSRNRLLESTLHSVFAGSR